jgi:hypothetical protein
MSRFSKLIRLPLTFKLLLAEAFLHLSAISILIRAAPRSYRLNGLGSNLEDEQAPGRLTFGNDDGDKRSGRRHTAPLYANSRNEAYGHTNPAGARDICEAIVIAARYVPGATCLVQCLTGRAMLRSVGCFAEIKIGVLKDSSDFHAHAWLENEDSVLLGGEITQYTQFGEPCAGNPKP